MKQSPDESYEICSCCGYEFGSCEYYCNSKYPVDIGYEFDYKEDEKFYSYVRKLWIQQGCKWNCSNQMQFKDWNIKKQLSNTGIEDQEIAGLLEDYLYDGPVATFSIIDNIDMEKNYSDANNFIIQKSSVGFFCNMIDFWYPEIANLSTCFNKVSRKEKGLNKSGVTIFPPQSLKEFYKIVDIKTPQDTPQKEKLLKLIIQAQEANKYLIIYGVYGV